MSEVLLVSYLECGCLIFSPLGQDISNEIPVVCNLAAIHAKRVVVQKKDSDFIKNVTTQKVRSNIFQHSFHCLYFVRAL